MKAFLFLCAIVVCALACCDSVVAQCRGGRCNGARASVRGGGIFNGRIRNAIASRPVARAVRFILPPYRRNSASSTSTRATCSNGSCTTAQCANGSCELSQQSVQKETEGETATAGAQNSSPVIVAPYKSTIDPASDVSDAPVAP